MPAKNRERQTPVRPRKGRRPLNLRRKHPEAGSGRLLLDDVAADARLDEGAEGVRRILRAVHLAGAIPIRDLAQEVGLPVPVVAAVRGELEKRKIFRRRRGVTLTEDGTTFVGDALGVSSRQRFPRPGIPDFPEELGDLRDHLADLAVGRPKVEVKLDQSHASVETALRRALYLYEYDAVEGRDILLLGDDDLTSLALGLLTTHLSVRIDRLVVLEFDRRLVDFLSETADLLDLAIEAEYHDLRDELPDKLKDAFDVFLTDPPYTLEGLNLFVSRGIDALYPQVCKQAFICFGRRSPSESSQAVGNLSQMGLALQEILPDFNQYVGAQVLGGVSQMIRAVTTREAHPLVKGPYRGDLYTADLKRRRNGR